jgi:ectoine hydroxylase-related dioxygenase (phytanoyl-CoA dioxygenase family)
MRTERETSWSTQLAANGFCLVPAALEMSIIERLKTLAARRLASAADEHLSRYAHHGSLIPLTIEDDPIAELLSSAKVRETFRRLGFTDPRWISGYVISKPPKSPGLWWHQDWWGWGHPLSYISRPTQIFCMIYLEPTSRANGCLRVLPRTHMERHHLHDALPEPHTVEIEAEPPDSPAHQPVPGELDIVAEPGDLVIGDVRVIHATHPNHTDSPRIAIDLLFAPHFATLPDEFKAYYVRQMCLPPAGWWDDPDHPLNNSPVRQMLPIYRGSDPGHVEFCRRPRWPENSHTKACRR